MDSTYSEEFDLSIIIPLHNEEAVFPMLVERLKKAGKDWGKYEVICMDDGSTDGTFSLAQEACKNYPELKVIKFSRNFGHQAAITAGLEHAKGNKTVLMDGDLQDPPELVKDLISKHKEGFDIVYAVRKTRREHPIKQFMYKGFYRLFKYLAYIDVPLDSGDFCLMSRRVVDSINALPERNRFVRGLRVWTGFSKTPLEYARDERAAGETKYPIMRLVRFGLSGIMAFSTKPLQISTYVGILIATFSFLGGILLIILRLTLDFAVTGWASLMLAVFFMGGVQLLILGVLGQYIGLIYMEVQNRPLYIVDKRLGF